MSKLPSTEYSPVSVCAIVADMVGDLVAAERVQPLVQHLEEFPEFGDAVAELRSTPWIDSVVTTICGGYVPAFLRLYDHCLLPPAIAGSCSARWR